MASVADMLHAYNPLYSVSGFIVGMLVGFTGVGGGSLMTPILVLIFGRPRPLSARICFTRRSPRATERSFTQ